MRGQGIAGQRAGSALAWSSFKSQGTTPLLHAIAEQMQKSQNPSYGYTVRNVVVCPCK